MKIIGICGSSGSGKSTVCSILSSFGAQILDCDQIYHELVSKRSPCLDEIAREFGDFLIVNDRLDRAALAKIVFSNPDRLARLNQISHHHVLIELKNRISILKSKSCELCIIDAPLLFESGLDTWCDFVCAVVASEALQVSRLHERDKISEEEAKLRLQNQISTEDLQKKVDFVIINDGDFDLLKDRCKDFIGTVFNQKG